MNKLMKKLLKNEIGIVITSTFNFNIIAADSTSVIMPVITRDSATGISELLEEFDYVSVVGREDIANVMSKQLGKHIECDRRVYYWDTQDEILIVGQYVGPRLPEGATLPDGAAIQYWIVISPSILYLLERMDEAHDIDESLVLASLSVDRDDL